MSLSTQILLGLGLGGLVGVLLGELVAPVGLVGNAFILLLQMTVLPYVAISLVKGLGSLSYQQAVSLARKAGGFLLLVWGISLGVVLLLPLAFPDWTSASFFSTNLVEERPPFDFLHLFIPANPFASLAQNVVPAVVVFSVALGIALIGIDGKQSLIAALTILTDALGSIASFVVRLAPLGVFAIAAEAAGTMDLEQIRGLQVFAVAYMAAALLLSFWVLPALVTTLTPLRYREVVGPARDALVTAFATGNVFVVLSVLAEKSKELVRLHVEEAQESDSLVGVVVPTAFTLPSAGKLLTLSFVLFAGWLSGFAVSYGQYPAFAVSGLFTFFGNTYVAVPFLLDMFRIPADTFGLFVIVDNIVGSRFGALLAAMHILVLTLLSACAIEGLIQIRWRKILRYALVTLVLSVGVLLGVRLAFDAVGHQYEKYRLFIQMRLKEKGVPARVREAPPEVLPVVDRSRPTLERIRERGSLRVGYRRDSLPFAFQNDYGELVGLDVEMAHHLARELGVKLEFVRVELEDLPRLLDAGYLDVAMTGLAVTTDRMEKMSFSAPVFDATLAFVVRDYRRHEFNSRKAVHGHESLKLGVPQAPYYVAKIREYLPQAEIVVLDSPRGFFRSKGGEFDAMVFSAEAGSAWCLVYPQFAVAVPHPDVLRAPVGYAVAHGDTQMASFLSLWIDLKRKDRTIGRLFDYWIRGRDEQQKKRRWSVVRDVLHWVD